MSPNSVVVGLVELSSGADTVNFHTGAGSVMTFDSLPEVIDTGGLPFVTSGTTVTVLAPEPFAQDAALLGQLTDGIADPVTGNFLDGFESGNLVTRRADPLGPDGARPLRFWGQLSGDLSQTAAGGMTTEATYTAYGGLVGVDAFAWNGGRAGFFAGASSGALDYATGGLTGNTLDTDSLYGGVYAGLEGANGYGLVMLSVGRTDYSSARQILNNSVPGGVETARGRYDGTFVAPTLAFGRSVQLGGHDLHLDGRLSYAHAMQSGYAETGAAGALTVQDRDLSFWQGRVQLSYPMAMGTTTLTPRIGVEARSTGDNPLAGLVFGQPVAFNTGGESAVTGFVGLSAETAVSDNAAFYFDVEMHGDDQGFASVNALAGLRIRF